tara:strand:+ start:174 stop:1577 length:1404 start_codon:yes stop_codon:yes gene_type:complete
LKIFNRDIIGDIKSSFSNKNEDNNTFLYKVMPDNVVSVFSEKIIKPEFLDSDSKQSLDDFKHFSNNRIKYRPNDFIIELSSESSKMVDENNITINTSDLISLGWYEKNTHNIEMKIINSSAASQLSSITSDNPSIKFNYFVQFRDSFRPSMATNVLNGALGLSYYYFEDDYNSFFRKINWNKNELLIKIDELSTIDRQILFQLLLYQSNKNSDLIKVISNEKKTLEFYNDVLEQSLNYFIVETYSMKGFLEYFINNNNSDDAKIFIEELKIISDKYIDKGLSFSPEISHSKYLKKFMDYSKVDQHEIQSLIEKGSDNLSKTAIFLLGMLHLGDKLEGQFDFDNFIPALIQLTMTHIIDIDFDENFIRIILDPEEVSKNRNNKFSVVKEYIHELRLVDSVIKKTKTLKEAPPVEEERKEEAPVEDGFVKEDFVEEESKEEAPVEELSEKVKVKKDKSPQGTLNLSSDE